MTRVSRGLVVCLHGLGDTGSGWAFLQNELQLPTNTFATRPNFLFPTAPTQPVTVNGGAKMTSWMDLDAIPLTPDANDHEPSIKASTKIVHDLLDQAVADGTPADEIVLGGFSQGAALSVYAGYTYSKKLAGIFAISGWPPLADELVEALRSGANRDTPALIEHGAHDQVVLPECGARTAELIRASGTPVTAELAYPVAHGPHPAGLELLGTFVAEHLGGGCVES